MKEMRDQELTDKIREVFDDFEDLSAEYGWQELRRKYPESNRQPVILWWAAAAAVVLMACGLWFIIPDRNSEVQKAENRKSSELNKKNRSEQASNNKSGEPQGIPSTGTDMLPYTPQLRSWNRSNVDKPTHQQAIAGNKQILTFSSDAVKRESSDVLNSDSSLLSAANNIHKQLVLSPHAHEPVLEDKNPILTRDSLINVTAAKLPALAHENPVTDYRHQLEVHPDASQKITHKNVAFSFYAGSYFNYSLGSETKLNFGAGFTSDIKLSNNFKLSTGLALANNSLTYNNGIPATGKEKLAFDVIPSSGATVSNNLTTVTKYDASLLVLDIPINLKYLLIPKDNKLYMLAGLSSGTYLSELYSVNYRNYSPAGAYVNQTQDAKERRQFQAFDFARILNISFGYSANIGKTQNITIEPFLKYPLGGLGSQDLKFGSTGVNLKLNFSQFKK